MGNRRVSMPTMFGGVSRQAPAIRHPNQVEEANNTLLTVRNGLTKRPALQRVFEVDSLVASGNYRLHVINRDQSEQYLMVYGDSTVRIFDLTGTEATVNGLGAGDSKDYLDAGSATADQLRVVTVADHSILLNTTVAVAAETTAAYEVERVVGDFDELLAFFPSIETQDADVVWDEGDLSLTEPSLFAEYKWKDGDKIYISAGNDATVGWHEIASKESNNEIRLSATAADPVGDEAAWTTQRIIRGDIYVKTKTDGQGRTAGFWHYTLDEDAGGFANLVFANVDDSWNLPTDNWDGSAQNPMGMTVEFIRTGDNEIYEWQEDFLVDAAASMAEIAVRLTKALQDAGAANAIITYQQRSVNFGFFTIVSPYRGSTESIEVPAAPESGFSMAATNAFPNVGSIFIDGTGSASPDTVPLIDRWERVAAPSDDEGQLDASTMPIQIVRTSLGPAVFTASQITWGFRETGDKDSNPIPSLWEEGVTLIDLAFHRNRLVLAGDDNVVLSQAGDFFNFYLDDSDNLVDSDPIDADLSSSKVALADWVIPFGRSLLVFSKAGEQFEMNSPDILTPSTASFVPSTAFLALEGVEPAVMGLSTYFLAKSGDTMQLMEYFFSDASVSNTASDVSSHVEGYLPATGRRVAVALNNDMVFVLPTDGNEIWVYRFVVQGDTKIQSAWAKYVLETTDRIVDLAVIDDHLWLLVENDAGEFIMAKMSIQKETAPTGMNFDPLLDMRSVVTGSNAAGFTTWTYLFDDTDVDTVVLGADFGATAGTVLTGLTRVGDNGVKIADATNAYGDNPAYVGRAFDMEATLSRPYVRDRSGAPILDGRLSLRKLVVNHTDTGEYDVRIAQPARTTRDVTFTPRDGSQVETEGRHEAVIMGRAEDVTVTLRNTSPKPCELVSLEWIGEFSPRSA